MAQGNNTKGIHKRNTDPHSHSCSKDEENNQDQNGEKRNAGEEVYPEVIKPTEKPSEPDQVPETDQKSVNVLKKRPAMEKTQNKNQDQIVQRLKEVHEKTKKNNNNVYQPQEDNTLSDLAEQMEGSDADVDSTVKTNASPKKSPQEQIKGSDADQD